MKKIAKLFATDETVLGMFMHVFVFRSHNTRHIDIFVLSKFFKRPMVIDSLNLNLSQISCQIADFNGLVDLRILADFWI